MGEKGGQAEKKRGKRPGPGGLSLLDYFRYMRPLRKTYVRLSWREAAAWTAGEDAGQSGLALAGRLVGLRGTLPAAYDGTEGTGAALARYRRALSAAKERLNQTAGYLNRHPGAWMLFDGKRGEGFRALMGKFLLAEATLARAAQEADGPAREARLADAAGRLADAAGEIESLLRRGLPALQRRLDGDTAAGKVPGRDNIGRQES